jgi:4-nitrophenyl phosphatase
MWSMTPSLVLCDLDGVVWLGDTPIAGASAAVQRLRDNGHRVLFVTNFSFGKVQEMEAKLAHHGIPAVGDVVTSAMAAASLVSRGERVLVAGGPGIEEAVAARGAEPLATRRGKYGVDAVIVGFHRTFDYEIMHEAASAVRAGARLIGTNDDPTYPSPDGPIPGAGAILASVAVASETVPSLAGKPHPPMAALVQRMVGDAWDASAVMVGDRWSTDGRFARELGCRFALVLSGVTHSRDANAADADMIFADLAEVADSLVASTT